MADLIMLMCMLQWAAYRLFDRYTGSLERAGSRSCRKKNGKSQSFVGRGGGEASNGVKTRESYSQFSLLNKVMETAALIPTEERETH